jgi:uncharacterized membrane protein YhhN
LLIYHTETAKKLRVLTVSRGLVALSLIAGTLFPLAEASAVSPSAQVFAKGICVALLALAALLRARSTDTALLAGIMAAGTLGDVLLELPEGFAAGAAAFALGHVIAIILYRRNAAPFAFGWRAALAAALLAIGAVAPWLMLPAGQTRIGVAIYGILLSAMAASAVLSRFPRIVPLGAIMFLLSDALIGARIGGALPHSTALGCAIWWLYYFGQFAIFAGVSRALAHAHD